jgi:transcription-repair coupling factor (superfamily II helicase)
MGTLFDYLQRDRVIFIEEPDAVEKEAEEFSRLIQNQYEKIRVRKSAVPLPESIYLNFDDLSGLLEKFQRVFLQDGPVAPPQCRQIFSFEMETNENLRREMKLALSGGNSCEGLSLSVLLEDFGTGKSGNEVLIASHTSGQAESCGTSSSTITFPAIWKRDGVHGSDGPPARQPLTLHISPLSSGFRNPREVGALTEEEIFGERRRLTDEKDGTGSHRFHQRTPGGRLCRPYGLWSGFQRPETPQYLGVSNVTFFWNTSTAINSRPRRPSQSHSTVCRIR